MLQFKGKGVYSAIAIGAASLFKRQQLQLSRRHIEDTHHEAILRLIEMSVRSAHANGAWIGICGELATDMELTETFLKMGIDELSVSPSFILPLREKIRSLDLSG